MTQTLVEQLCSVIAALARLDQALEKLFGQHPDQKLFSGLPGAGEALGPRLAAAFGTDRERYQSAEEIQQFSGVAPVTESSGKMHWVHWRLACPKFLRQTFHEFADASRRKSLWAQAYYAERRQRGCVSSKSTVREKGSLRQLAPSFIYMTRAQADLRQSDGVLTNLGFC